MTVMRSARSIILVICFALLVFAGNASAQTTSIVWNSIPHPTAKLNALIEYGSKLIAGNVDGVFVSADNGQTWVVQNNGLPNSIQIFQLVTLNHQIFAATDKGIWKSEDEAQSWSEAGAGVISNRKVQAIHILGGNIFAGTSSGTAGSGRIMLSTDLGQNWKDVTVGLPAFDFASGFCSIGNTLVALINGGIFKSSDNGNSWKKGGSSGRFQEVKASGAVMFAIGEYYNAVRTYAASWTSSDLGETWNITQERGGPFLFPSYYSLAVSGSNYLVCYAQSRIPYSSFEASFLAEKLSTSSYLYYNQDIGAYSRIFLAADRIYLTKIDHSSGSFLELLQSDRKVVTPVATIVSAANYQTTALASESIGSMFGTGLALTTAAASAEILNTLENVSVLVTDSKGAEKTAPLFYISPTQINFQLPTGLAGGTGIVTVKLYNQVVASGMIAIANTSPGLFSVNQTGEGFAAANVQKITANGSVTFEPIAQYDANAQKFIPVPINVQAGADQVYLNLYGTGIRGRSGLANVKATVGGLSVPVSYAGPHRTFSGVDQVNILLPSSLAGKQEVNVILTVDNQVANPVKIFIQ